MKRWFIFLTPAYLKVLVYMLQATEYQPGPYLTWWWRTRDFRKATYRRTLDSTKPAKLLLLGLYVWAFSYAALTVWALTAELWMHAALLVLLYPAITAHGAVLPLAIARAVIVRPRQRRLVAKSKDIFNNHPASKIAVLGSYGKTSMKELLATVLASELKVAATPGNKNVPVSHAAFAAGLDGDEDVLIIEYGEGAPGDVAAFARTTHPTHAIITGVAPAHLDQYKTVEAAAKDIFSVVDFVESDKCFVNTNSPIAVRYITDSLNPYNIDGALGWKASDITIDFEGTSFTLTKNAETMHIKSGLVGEHHAGPLALAAALARQLGVSKANIEHAIAATAPHAHRMQPYQLGGAWIIDDTYNGNIESVRAGTKLMSKLKAKRKVYVTPGLVDQGAETERVHTEVGRLVAAAKFDVVVLMKNSVTQYIQAGLENEGFAGEIIIEEHPLEFYTDLSHFVAAGDVVLMQNDWTDNYV